jgi:hypothetical protein
MTTQNARGRPADYCYDGQADVAGGTTPVPAAGNGALSANYAGL